MGQVICGVCRRLFDRGNCEVIVPTEKERAALQSPLDEYVFCKPCYRVSSDPTTAPDLMAGIMQHHLRRIGVGNAERLSEKYRAALLAKAVRRS